MKISALEFHTYIESGKIDQELSPILLKLKTDHRLIEDEYTLRLILRR